MAKDVYNIETLIGGAWQLDGAVINMEGAEDVIITSTQIQYTRPSTKFSPLNQRKRYMLCGEANGRITMGLIIGPSKAIQAFLQRYANACNVKSNVLSLSPAGLKDCDQADDSAVPLEFVCNGVLIDDITVNIQQVGQALTMVGAGLGLSFVSLQIK